MFLAINIKNTCAPGAMMTLPIPPSIQCQTEAA
ncbi:aminoglycoside resistance protein, partial [Salmonella enterica]|nr:aminoglycoside resistance protein [Salmonella enterica]EAX8433184.1 aminoglycoside resistance protein [Salmonella enterica]EBQ6568078.1 aminoglycoside resistance protein [Salmonella enterica]